MRTLLPVAAVVLLATGVLAGETLRCSICSNGISGKYVRMSYNGKQISICLSCQKKVMRCRRCGTLIKRNQLGFCQGCTESLPKCGRCKKHITGAHSKFPDGTRYCATCIKDKRCPRCNKPLPLDGGVAVGDLKTCGDCAKKMPVCASCDKAVVGPYYRHIFVEGVFCKHCETTRPKCTICSSPIGKNPVKRIAGTRPICNPCFATAVLTRKETEAIFAECKKIIDAELKESVYHNLPIETVSDIARVRENAGESSGNELGLFQRKGEDYKIFLLYGLTRELTFETLSHEWGHAWFSEHGDPLHPQWVEEGFCQWVASRVLIKKKYERGLKILSSRNDMYGKGYRYIKAIERKGNAKAVFKYVTSRPPANVSRPRKRRDN